MATTRKKRKKRKKLSIKQLDAKAQELIQILHKNAKYVPDAPTMSDVKNDKSNFNNTNYRKGHGTGNTKQNKKQMKRNHELLLNLWIQQLQDAVNQIK